MFRLVNLNLTLTLHLSAPAGPGGFGAGQPAQQVGRPRGLQRDRRRGAAGHAGHVRRAARGVRVRLHVWGDRCAFFQPARASTFRVQASILNASLTNGGWQYWASTSAFSRPEQRARLVLDLHWHQTPGFRGQGSLGYRRVQSAMPSLKSSVFTSGATAAPSQRISLHSCGDLSLHGG